MSDSLQAVIFDLDGTLVDHVGSVTAALRAWLPTLGHNATDDLISAWIEAEHRHFPAWRSRQITFAEQRRRRLRDFLPLLDLAPNDDDTLDRTFQGYLQSYETAWTKFDDVDAAVVAIGKSRLRAAILSNGTVEQQNAKVAAVGLRGRLGPVFTAEELGVAKPDPASYRAVCSHLDVEPHRVLHIGDLYDLDVLAARAAGLQAIHLDRADNGPHEEPDRVTSLRGLQHRLAAL